MSSKSTYVSVALLLVCGACSKESDEPSEADPMQSPMGSAGADANPGDEPSQTPSGPGDDPQGTEDPMSMEDPDPQGPGSDPTTPLGMIPASCRGFEVAGLEYSPGGDVLPNTCAPFEPRLNNPYAIRCVDADPSYDTGYPGDELCILPPAPENGIQLRVTPADLASPEAGFVLSPGDEVTDYYYANTANPEQHYFYRVNLRMRPGSHHIINRMLDADRTDGFSSQGDNGFSGFGAGGGGGGRSFPGAQRPDQDRPQGTLEVPPENDGLGDVLLPNQQFSLNMHHFNLTDAPTLREVWINIWYKPESEVTAEMGGIAIFGNPRDVSIPAGEHRLLHYVCDVPGSTRIITLNGHRHAWTDRFGVWLERPSGENVPIYESFDYNDMPTYQYDSVSTNPTPNVETQTDGAFSGQLEVNAGDRLHFVCDITNGSGGALRFANEVQTGEMCILFGSRTGAALCGGPLTNTPL